MTTYAEATGRQAPRGGVSMCEWEASQSTTPQGVRHLHLLPVKSFPDWVVRSGRKTPLCGTPRCRVVYIGLPYKRYEEA